MSDNPISDSLRNRLILALHREKVFISDHSLSTIIEETVQWLKDKAPAELYDFENREDKYNAERIVQRAFAYDLARRVEN